MRALFTSTSGFGSFHPVMALASATRAAGHDVAVATGEERRSTVERLGMPLFPAGGDTFALMRERHPAVPMPPIDADSTKLALRLALGGVVVELMLPGVLEACRSWRPDVVVRGHLTYAGWLAAEELGIPHSVVEEYSSGQPASDRPNMTGVLNDWLAKRGLTPDAELASLHRYLTFVPFPPSLRHPDAPFPLNGRRMQPLIFSDAFHDQVPAWMEHLPSGPLVHASLGTASARPDLLRSIIAGLEGEPLTLVVATGPRISPADLGPLPANVRAVPYVPHAAFLPRCDAIITHAGAGTLIAAVDAGLPMVLIPLFGDQPLNAESAAAAGVARVLDQATITPEAVREATHAVLNHESYREHLGHLRDEIAALPPVAQGVRWLERIAQTRAPLDTDE